MEINRTCIITDALPSPSKTGIKQHTSGLAATTLISAGSVILSTSKPYHILLENAFLSKIATPKLKRCSRCHIPSYCSPTCQKSHWSTAHKYECGILASLPPLPGPLPTPVRALMQVLLLKDQGGPWEGMESHEEEIRVKQGEGGWEDVVLQARAAVGYSGLGDAVLGKAAGLLCRMKTNSFRLNTPTARGLLFDPYLATANHSCAPNATLSCTGRTVQLVALWEIQKGEQVWISYVDEEMGVEERREALRERYFFECGCERCVVELREGEDAAGDPA